MKKSVTLVLLCFIVICTDHRALSSTTTATKTTKTAGECDTNSSWTPRNRYCYLYLAEVANFTQAVESCHRQGAHLVSIGSEEENKFIQDLVGTSNLPVWIGLYRSTNDICAGDSCENWMWLDGSELGYSQWATGPFPSPGQCTIMDSRGDWDHYRRCSGELSYVCKQQVQMIPTTTSDGCQSDLSWKPHNQSCYLHLGMKLNFTQANESCEELGAHLVSISSGEENQFIMDFVGKEPAWIGLYRTTNEFCLGEACGHWMWLDGSELGYSQWATGPFPSPGQCTFMNPLGDWYHNTKCSDELDCVCEMKRIFPVTISESTTAMIPIDMTEARLSDQVVSVVPTTDSREDGINVPLVVGCVVGGLVVVGIVTAVAVTTGKHHRQSSTNEQQNNNKRGNSLTTDIENNSPPRDLLKESKDGKSSQRNQSNVDQDIDSSPTDVRKKCNKEDRLKEGVNGRFNRGYCYEDVEAERTNEVFKGGPAFERVYLSARGREVNPDNIYSEPIKKKDR